MTPRKSTGRRFSVRYSPIHGRGVFALRRIRKGTRLIEYRGERISQQEASRRTEKSAQDPFTLLFEVDEDTVIDAAVGGNSARYINHSCSPNCESVDEDGRIFIEAIGDIRPDDELTYDYQLQTEGPITHELKALFACNCGTSKCRGTMLKLGTNTHE